VDYDSFWVRVVVEVIGNGIGEFHHAAVASARVAFGAGCDQIAVCVIPTFANWDYMIQGELRTIFEGCPAPATGHPISEVDG